MKRIEYIIIGFVIILGCAGFGGWKYVAHQDQLKKQAIAAQQAEQQAEQAQEAQEAANQAQQQASQAATAKQELQNCISTANQQEISQLQDEKDTLAEDNASGTYYDTDTVNSYVQEIQQQAQTQITECQAQYPQ